MGPPILRSLPGVSGMSPLLSLPFAIPPLCDPSPLQSQGCPLCDPPMPESHRDRQIPYGSPNPYADDSRRDGQVIPIACHTGGRVMKRRILYGLPLIAMSGCQYPRCRRPCSPLQFQNTSDTYREIGHRNAESERRGSLCAARGERHRKRFDDDLTARRGVSKSDIALMRASYLRSEIFQTASGKGLAQYPPAAHLEFPGDSPYG